MSLSLVKPEPTKLQLLLRAAGGKSKVAVESRAKLQDRVTAELRKAVGR